MTAFLAVWLGLSPCRSFAYAPAPFEGPVQAASMRLNVACTPGGRLLTASNSVCRNAFAYDAMDRLTLAATSLSNATYNVTYHRDVGGLVTNLVYASGKTLTRTYDPDGRLASVSDWLGHTWTFAWDGAGDERVQSPRPCRRATAISWPMHSIGAKSGIPRCSGNPTGGTAPGGIVATNHYDAAGRLSSWSVGTLAGRTITRDLAGLKTRDDITAGPHPVPSFVRYAENTFDAADRLVSAQVRYGSHTNAAVSETYQYDGNGALTNLVSASNAVFSAAYDPLGQLGSLSQPSTLNPQPFSYDPLGNRLVSGDHLFIPDHADPLKRPLIEADAASGTPIRYYLWAPGRLLGFIDAASGTLTVAHCDDYGSVVALTDSSGNTLHTASYGSNGQDWGSTGTNLTPFTWLGGHGVRQIAVSDHLGPHSSINASIRGAIGPNTGCGRGFDSSRRGSDWAKYFCTVRRFSPSSRAIRRTLIPSAKCLCRITCTCSILSMLLPFLTPHAPEEIMPQGGAFSDGRLVHFPMAGSSIGIGIEKSRTHLISTLNHPEPK